MGPQSPIRDCVALGHSPTWGYVPACPDGAPCHPACPVVTYSHSCIHIPRDFQRSVVECRRPSGL
eukprot:5381778-Prymnesium_polylepis.1